MTLRKQGGGILRGVGTPPPLSALVWRMWSKADEEMTPVQKQEQDLQMGNVLNILIKWIEYTNWLARNESNSFISRTNTTR